MPHPDEQCIQQSLNGHPEAFGELVRRYQGPLLSYLIGKLGDLERAEEAAQETFVRAFVLLHRLRRAEAFFSWLLGIANRVVREHFRADRRAREVPEGGRRSAQTRVRSAEFEDDDLRRAIAELPRVYAEVVLLRYYGEFSCADVARQLDLPLGTVTKRLSRAYAMLRESLSSRSRGPVRNEVPR